MSLAPQTDGRTAVPVPQSLNENLEGVRLVVLREQIETRKFVNSQFFRGRVSTPRTFALRMLPVSDGIAVVM